MAWVRSLLVIPATLSASLVVACGASSNRPSKAALTALTQAAYVTTREPGFEFTMKVTANRGGQSAAVTGAGMSADGGREGTMTMAINGRTLTLLARWPYVYVPAIVAPAVWGLPNTTGGKPWVRANYLVYNQPVGANLGGTDPILALNAIKATGRVTAVGAQSVNGVPTTHYHALVDANRIISTVPSARRAAARQYAQTLRRATGSTTLPIDVWIDANQHVRRITLHLQVCVPGGKLDESTTFDIVRYHNPPTVRVPPASQFTDITDRLKTKTSQALKQLPGC